jgi:hypothetical protein
MAAAATATLELHSTVPSSHATNKRCKTPRCCQRCEFWWLNIFNMFVSLVDARFSYKRVFSQPFVTCYVMSRGLLYLFYQRPVAGGSACSMALATPRRMWISSSRRWARFSSAFRRGTSFLGAAGSR